MPHIYLKSDLYELERLQVTYVICVLVDLSEKVQNCSFILEVTPPFIGYTWGYDMKKVMSVVCYLHLSRYRYHQQEHEHTYRADCFLD